MILNRSLYLLAKHNDSCHNLTYGKKFDYVEAGRSTAPFGWKGVDSF
jgi:hypothetical protein